MCLLSAISKSGHTTKPETNMSHTEVYSNHSLAGSLASLGRREETEMRKYICKNSIPAALHLLKLGHGPILVRQRHQKVTSQATHDTHQLGLPLPREAVDFEARRVSSRSHNDGNATSCDVPPPKRFQASRLETSYSQTLGRWKSPVPWKKNNNMPKYIFQVGLKSRFWWWTEQNFTFVIPSPR